MQENKFKGKYIYVNYLDSITGGMMVYGGKLEEIIFDEDGMYKVKLNPIFDIDENGKYSQMKGKSIKVLTPENYLGVEEDTKKNMETFYQNINAQILKNKNDENFPNVEEAYAKEGNTRNNFYSHEPGMGFKIDYTKNKPK